MTEAVLPVAMNEALISAVCRREPVWNPTNHLHRNVYVLKKLWKEVAVEVQKDIKTIKARWKNLRAYFYKEQRKIDSSKGDNKMCYSSTWQYYDQLLFLRGHGTASERGSTLSDNDSESMIYEIPLEEQNELSDSDDTSHEAPSKKRKRNTEFDNNEKLLEIEKKRLEILERECTKEKSDDLLFFESLLPYMSSIPVVRKLRLRSKIQDLILSEIETVELKQEMPDSP